MNLSLSLPCGRMVLWEFSGAWPATLCREISKALVTPLSPPSRIAPALRVEVSAVDDFDAIADDPAVISMIDRLYCARLVSGGVHILLHSGSIPDFRQTLWLMKRIVLYGSAPLTLAGEGIFIHGALLTRSGGGVLLTGSSGSGKTTCARRVASPWRALSDDLALVTCREGEYYAQGLPTWSQFYPGRKFDQFDWNRSVRLNAVFQMEPAESDEVVELSQAERVGTVLAGFSEFRHAWNVASGNPFKTQLAQAALNFSGGLAGGVRVKKLRHSMHGRFWEKLEPFLQKRNDLA